MNSNLTRVISPNGEIITIVPIVIMIDNNTNELFAFDESKQVRHSISEMRQKAESDDPSAQCAMGDYYNVLGHNEIPHEAIKWYQKAAKQNHAKAMYHLGTYYAMGRSVEKSFEKAVSLFEESAKHGFLEAMWQLGQVHIIKTNYDEAIYWLEKADNLGYPDPQKLLEVARMLIKYADVPEVMEYNKQLSKDFWGS